MKTLFCNITYMRSYTGNIEEDIPQGGGAWVKEHNDAHEKWNFLNEDGCCYGFVMNKGNQFHIERLEDTSANTLSTDKVTVVWCALKPDGNTVIVGWYENATVYRHYQRIGLTPFGIDRDFFVEADADDCYLLPEEKRTYIIGRASEQGTGRGFGQSNIWYADSEYAKHEIVPDVIEFINAHRCARINITNDFFAEPTDIDVPLSSEEEDLANQLYSESEYRRFLPLGYRAFRHNPTADNAYNIAAALRGAYQFGMAINWYNKVIEIEGDSWEISSCLPYLLTECGRYDEAIAAATHLLSFDEAQDIDVKHEIYSSLADNNFYLGNTEEAVSWLDKIISESNDADLVEHTKAVRKNWLEQ